LNSGSFFKLPAALLGCVAVKWNKQSYQHKHSVEQKDKPITEVDIVGQVDLRRLNNDELREFERLQSKLDLSSLRETIRTDSILPRHEADRRERAVVRAQRPNPQGVRRAQGPVRGES